MPPYLPGSGSKPKAKEKTLLRLFPRHQKIVVESNQRLCNKGAAAGGRPALHDHRHDRDRRGESNRRRQGGDFAASLPWPGRQSSSGSHILLREGFKKSKWKFKMAFAMKAGEGSRGGLDCHLHILKNDFFKNHLESFPDCENVFCT